MELERKTHPFWVFWKCMDMICYLMESLGKKLARCQWFGDWASFGLPRLAAPAVGTGAKAPWFVACDFWPLTFPMVSSFLKVLLLTTSPGGLVRMVNHFKIMWRFLVWIKGNFSLLPRRSGDSRGLVDILFMILTNSKCVCHWVCICFT